ncbi:ROK family protein [Pengzhenrongella sp.]|uniref:ROK family protein n=1 Tax=Pengzhenrongella sp. TaxID=2888820 RepID=UPI002F945B7C
MTAPPCGQRAEQSFVLGLDIGGTKVALATSSLEGALLQTSRIPTGAAAGAALVWPRVMDAARELVARTEADHGGVLVGVGLTCPGVIADDGVLLAPNNPGWQTLPVRRLLAEAFVGCPVDVVNDVQAAAKAELELGALVGVRSGLFVNLGSGISAAIVVDGQVVRGGHGAAGEIAYQVVGPMPGAAFAEGRAPLEEAVSGLGIAARASELLGHPVTTAEVFARYDHDPQLSRFLDDTIDLLAVHLANLVVALDPERVVFAGGLMAQSDVVLPRVRRVFERVVPFPPAVLLARLPGDAGLAGALVTARSAGLGAARHPLPSAPTGSRS